LEDVVEAIELFLGTSGELRVKTFEKFEKFLVSN
jgi:hypothetical protein